MQNVKKYYFYVLEKGGLIQLQEKYNYEKYTTNIIHTTTKPS